MLGIFFCLFDKSETKTFTWSFYKGFNGQSQLLEIDFTTHYVSVSGPKTVQHLNVFCIFSPSHNIQYSPDKNCLTWKILAWPKVLPIILFTRVGKLFSNRPKVIHVKQLEFSWIENSIRTFDTFPFPIFLHPSPDGIIKITWLYATSFCIIYTASFLSSSLSLPSDTDVQSHTLFCKWTRFPLISIITRLLAQEKEDNKFVSRWNLPPSPPDFNQMSE